MVVVVVVAAAAAAAAAAAVKGLGKVSHVWLFSRFMWINGSN